MAPSLEDVSAAADRAMWRLTQMYPAEYRALLMEETLRLKALEREAVNEQKYEEAKRPDR